MLQLPEFLESMSYRNPVEPNKGLLQYANQTQLSTTEWLQSNPKYMAKVTAGMSAWAKSWQYTTQAALSSLFPVRRIPSGSFDPRTLLVDIGGGEGAVVKDLRMSRPDLKGRMVFQDLAEVIPGKENIDGVEGLTYDFFTPQPIHSKSCIPPRCLSPMI